MLAKATITLSSLPAALTVYMEQQDARALLTSWGKPAATVVQFQGHTHKEPRGASETFSLANRDISYIRISWPEDAAKELEGDMRALREAHEALENSPRKEMASEIPLNPNGIDEGLLKAAKAAGVLPPDA